MKPNLTPHTEIATLCELGLTRNEAVLYTYLLGRPRSTVHELGAGAPFPRTMLYHVLNQLIRTGLVTARKEKSKTLYIAESPERLYELLEKAEHEHKQRSGAIHKLIPRLKHRYHFAATRTNVRVFEGVEAYGKALDDQIRSSPKEVLIYEDLARKRPGREMREAHDRNRVARKIPAKVLFWDEKNSHQNLRQRPYDDFTQYRAIRRGPVEPFKIDLALYDGKLLYTSYDEYEPAAILIEDKPLYEMQKSLFVSLWKSGTDRTLHLTQQP